MEPQFAAPQPLLGDGDGWRMLFEHSADAMALLDPATGNVVDCNESFVRLAGSEGRGDMRGRRFPVMTMDALRLCREQGNHRFEGELTRPDGVSVLLDVVATTIPSREVPLVLTTARPVDRGKRIEDDPRVSESRWQRLFEQAPISVQIFAPDGTSIRENAAFKKLFEPVVPDLPDFNIRTDPQLDAAGFREPIERAFAGEVVKIPPIPFEMRIGASQPAKGVRWIGSTMFPVVDPDSQKLIEVVCVHEDHTARILAEAELRDLNQSLEGRIAERTAELRESEARFKALFQHSPLGMARVSWDGKFLQVNPSFAQMIGYTPDEVLGLSYWDVTPIEYFEQEQRILEVVREKGYFGPFEKDYIHRDGHRVPIVLSGMMIQAADGSNELWGIAQDVTVRKRAEDAVRASEKKFRTLFEESRQGVMIHDENTSFSEVNPAAALLLGHPPEYFVGRHPSEIAPEYQPNGELSSVVARREIEKCLTTGTARFEWMHLHADGHEVLLEVVLSRIPHGDKDLMQAVIIDISERKRAEEELKRALERERELSQLKSNFVSMVSHEFRTPLGIIQSSAEILDDYLDQLDPEERRDQLASIIKNSRRMAGLMEDVLLLGRLDSGRMEFVPKPLDLASLCRRLVDEVRSTTDAICPIEFSTVGLPPAASADERLLRHILLNLLSNAVKYSPPGSPVTLRASAEPEAITFRISDQGIGIPHEDLPGLFEAFRRGSNVGQTPGTGLGLVIVKQSVELHCGRIVVESRPEGGTTFTVAIPFIPPESDS